MNISIATRLFFSLLLILVIGLVESPQTSAQEGDNPSKNVTLFDHIEPITIQDAGGMHNSCWGYAATDGREYAFFGTQVGTYVIDVTEKPIRLVSYVPGPRSTWRNIKVFDHYAYIVNETRNVDEGSGLQIVDLSTLPDSVHLIRTDTSHFLSAHTISITDHYLYAYGTRAEAGVNGGALILDLLPDPLHPVRAGKVDPYYFHDGFVRNDTLLGAGVYGDGASIYDVHDKANPQLLGRIIYPYNGNHNAELTSDGRYVLTSDEIGFTKKTMKVWDISDLDDIVMVAEFTPNIVETIHNVRVHGRYAFVAWYTAGLRIVDMIDPVHPREVGFFDSYPGKDGGFSGAWETYPHLPSGKILLSDRNSGLYVLEFNGVTAGSISGVVKNSQTGEPIADIVLDRSIPGAEIRSDAVGRYYLGGVNGETKSISIRRYGYRDTTLTVTFDGDVTQDILLEPLPFRNLTIRAVDASTGDVISNFSYAFPPNILSSNANGAKTIVSIPATVDLTLVTGKWGHKVKRTLIPASSDDSELTVKLEQGYNDDFSLDLGWSTEAPGDQAISGRWNRLRPYLGYPNSDWIHPPSEPSGGDDFIYFTGHPPLFAAPESDDVNGGRTSLTSPAMDMSSYGDPMITFDRWFVHFEKDTVRDSLVVELSNDNGETWHPVYNEFRQLAAWKPVVLFPRQHLPLTSQMKIRIRVSDTLGNALIVAGIDNFEVFDRIFSGVNEESEIVIQRNRHSYVTDRDGIAQIPVDLMDQDLVYVYALNGAVVRAVVTSSRGMTAIDFSRQDRGVYVVVFVREARMEAVRVLKTK